MTSGTAALENNGSAPQFTKADQIKQLNDIDKKITQLIRSAGEAVKTLTALNQDSASNRREAYTNAANTYFKKLEEVDLSSKQQLKTLKDAHIIPKGTKKGHRKADTAKPTSDDRADVMDIGWLNTRSQKVGRDMEAEIWEKARLFLEGADQNGPMRLPETWSSIPAGRPFEDSDRKKLVAGGCSRKGSEVKE